MKKESLGIQPIIDQLGDVNSTSYKEALGTLIGLGPAAVPDLTRALHDGSEVVKTEVARLMGIIGNKEALRVLVEDLRSNDFDTRYNAIQGLPLSGDKAIRPLLKAFFDGPATHEFLASAHVVLHRIASQGYIDLLKPVLVALESAEPDLDAPVAAYNALDALDKINRTP